MNSERFNNSNVNGEKKSVKKKSVRKPDKTLQKMVDKFLAHIDVAPWFRGTSHYHIKGSDGLLNALRDDAEQRTTHRVRACLNLIGLQPMITSKQITFLMKLSRCNDLIFLWFLMEMHYKTPKPGSYSVNEQLICSAICHLDMITTLRELDKILPIGNKSKFNTHQSGIQRTGLQEKPTLNRPKARNFPKYMSPYFEKNPRPRHFGKKLTLEIPNFKADFSMYANYQDPNYCVLNESNRWCANYELKPVKRIVHAIIRETLDYFFNCWENDIPIKFKSTDILCNYHKNLKNKEINLKHEERVKCRDACLAKYFRTDNDPMTRAERTHKLLNMAVERELCKFETEKELLRKHGMTLKTITSDLQVLNVIVGNDFDDNTHIDLQKETNKPDTQTESNNNASNKKQTTAQTNNKILDNEYEKNYDFNDVYMYEIPTPSKTVFRCPTRDKPYSFDYKKIFSLNDDYDDHDDKTRIQKSCLQALDVNISELSNDLRNNECSYDRAVTECAKNLLDEKLREYEENMKDYLALQAEENTKPLNQYPTYANYDAKDNVLMNKMLYDAFQYLRKNPKFVWAQLPDAHKVPMLREWIARRFGKEYSYEKRFASYSKSCKIFRALDKIQVDFPFPNTNQIGKNQYLSYDCRNYLDRKVKYLKNKYYNNLDSSFLEYTRIFWFAMRGYVCANGPPRKTFFAYMPSKFQDIQHFRLWKSYEYRKPKTPEKH